MEISAVLRVYFVFCVACVSWAIEPISVGVGIAAVFTASASLYDRTLCRFMECCDEFSISLNANNITNLNAVFKNIVYGQHLMEDIVIKALRAHLSVEPAKALVFSFHGGSGIGKSFVSELIAQALFLKGSKSKFVKKFSAGLHFPDSRLKNQYKIKIINEITKVVSGCERSLFIFEDVHLMPLGVLDAISPFIDHHAYVNGVDFRKSIFILTSNIGTKLINSKTLELWSRFSERESAVKLQDFEPIIRQIAFNEKGGLEKSDTIERNLIDYYIPFLPLEEKHVKKCIADEFKKYDYHSPPDHAFQEILQDMTFMPPEHLLYSASGCKRVAAKVAAYVEGLKFSKEKISQYDLKS